MPEGEGRAAEAAEVALFGRGCGRASLKRLRVCLESDGRWLIHDTDLSW